MKAPHVPFDRGPVFGAVADAMATAAAYADTAVRFAEVRDVRGLAYATRCTTAALMSAADLVEELRHSLHQGGRQG